MLFPNCLFVFRWRQNEKHSNRFRRNKSIREKSQKSKKKSLNVFVPDLIEPCSSSIRQKKSLTFEIGNKTKFKKIDKTKHLTWSSKQHYCIYYSIVSFRIFWFFLVGIVCWHFFPVQVASMMNLCATVHPSWGKIIKIDKKTN